MSTAFVTANPLALRPRWLVVDDDAELAALMAAVLVGLGRASVESCTSPQAALAAFAGHAGEFDLVVTDRDMPECDGLELARRLHAHAPDLKVILISARTDDLTAETLQRAGISAVLRKPFPLAELEAAVSATRPAALAHAA